MKIDKLIILKLFTLAFLFICFSNEIFAKKDDEIEPEIDDFVACEKEPQVDLKKLNNCIVYPEEARKNGIQGKVIVRILVGKEGELRRFKIEKSENTIFNDAVISALNCYGKFIPAVQKGKNILCWVSIPINFKLNDLEKKTNDDNCKSKLDGKDKNND